MSPASSSSGPVLTPRQVVLILFAGGAATHCSTRTVVENPKLVIDVVNFNGYATLGTIGHPASDQAHLTMTFERPDMGRILFNWVLEDPKTYTRPIRNERVFVLTPNVELMEYACMENNLQSLLDGAITPWVGPQNHTASVVPLPTYGSITRSPGSVQELTSRSSSASGFCVG